jgi:hypothetical protein
MVSQTDSNGRFPIGGGNTPAPAKIRAKFGSINSSYSKSSCSEGMILPIPGPVMVMDSFCEVAFSGDLSDSDSERESPDCSGELDVPPGAAEVEASQLFCLAANLFDSPTAHLSACSSVRSFGSPCASSSKSSWTAFSLPSRTGQHCGES